MRLFDQASSMYDMKIKYEKVDVAWQCISERLWKCLVGRYGGCFEERYNEVYVGERNRKKKSCLRNKIPRSSKKDRIQGLGQCSPTVAAEEELVKRVDVVEVVEVDLPRTIP